MLVLPAILLLVFAKQASSQDSPNVQAREYVHDWHDKLTLKFELNNQIEGFAVSFGPDNQKLKLRPNDKLVSNLYLNYRIISLHLALKPNFIDWNNDNEARGKTHFFKLNTRFYLNQFITELGYYRTKGYYLANPEKFATDWQPGDPYPQFPNLVTKHFGGETSYVINPNFSVRSVLDHSQVQRISQGSFVPSLFYQYYQNEDKTPLTATNSSQKANNFELMLNLSHWQTLVIKKNFRFSTAIGVGAGAIHTNLKTRYIDETFKSKTTLAIYRGELLGDLAYDNGKFFTGFRALFQGETYSQSKSTDGVIVQNHSLLNFYLGVRVGAPKFLRRLDHKVEELIP